MPLDVYLNENLSWPQSYCIDGCSGFIYHSQAWQHFKCHSPGEEWASCGSSGASLTEEEEGGRRPRDLANCWRRKPASVYTASDTSPRVDIPGEATSEGREAGRPLWGAGEGADYTEAWYPSDGPFLGLVLSAGDAALFVRTWGSGTLRKVDFTACKLYLHEGRHFLQSRLCLPKFFTCIYLILTTALQMKLCCVCVCSVINPKGNQSWIFIGRTDAEAPVLWPPDVKSWLTGKDPDAGKDWRQEEKGTTKDEMVGWHHRLNGWEFEQAQRVWWWTGKPGVLHSMGSQRFGHDWATELNWTELSFFLQGS